MTLLVTAGITLLALLALFFAAKRDITLCEIEIEKGELFVVRGGLSPKVLGDLRDVVKRARVKHATVRVLRVKDHARVEASSGLSQEHLQTVRNVVTGVPLAKLLAGARKASPRAARRVRK